jgi:hypothetical protein
MTSNIQAIGKPTPKKVCVLSAALGLIIIAIILLSCGKQGDEEKTGGKPTSSSSNSRQQIQEDIEKIIGQWRRPDGGYVIDIRGVQPDGKLHAGYYNPRPINVSEAKAFVKGDMINVFVELYDERYPGSTYELTYDSRSDALVGTYFQAAIRHSFEVVFVRMK